MLKLVTENQFEKDIKKATKRGKNLENLRLLVDLLIHEKQLPKKNRNHKLKGEYHSYWECHIEPNWLLIYKKTETEIILARTGTHSDLF